MSEILRRSAQNKNLQMLYDAAYKKKDAELFEKLLKTPGCKLLIPAISREIMRLNFYVAADNLEMVRDVRKKISKLRLNNENAKAFYGAAFGFFAEKGERELCEQLLQEMRKQFDGTTDPAAVMMLFDCQLVYDVYIDRNLDRIDGLKQLISAAPDNESKSVYQYRLAKLYHYAGQRSNCIEQLKAARANTSSKKAKDKIGRIINGRWEEL